MIRIAVQKSGRLFEDSVALLRDAGIQFSTSTYRLRTEASNFPLEIIFLRDDDIPEYVEEGVVDIGIVGENVLLEKNKQVNVLERLGFGRCRLCLAMPRNTHYEGPSSLQGKRIATTYTRILRNFLQQEGIKAEVHEISGSVEIAPSLGLADAIFDIVSTGSTLLANGLQEVETVMESEAVFIATKHLTAEKTDILERLLFRMRANRNATAYRYILLNAPKKSLEHIIRILPGMKSPTILPLAEPDWVSVHSVIKEEDFWEVIEQLKAAGAQGILVTTLDRLIL
jgi:ATP phosphoribosyltransferase